ncbi:hypothetical protein B9057_15920 (plasmid) [Aestuarium zhoushanense]|nr:hypothetical protein B9057_15920 [Aestuarium zhoushanense]
MFEFCGQRDDEALDFRKSEDHLRMKDTYDPPAETNDANPRAISVRLKGKSQAQAYGQRHHDYRQGPQPQYVDMGRVHLNRVLISPRPVKAIKEEVEGLRRDRKRKMKSNACIVTAGIITFGHQAAQWFEELSVEDQDATFLAVASGIAERLNTRLEGLVVHRDEATIHAHFELRGYGNSGEPLSKVMTPTIMSELQDIAATTAQQYCSLIERGNKKYDRLAAGAAYAKTVNKSVKQLHRELPEDLEKLQKEIAASAAKKQDIEVSVAKARRLLTKLEGERALSEKEIKRAAIYKTRLEKKEAELTALDAQMALRKQALGAAEKAILTREQSLAQERIAQSEKEENLRRGAEMIDSKARALKAEAEEVQKRKEKVEKREEAADQMVGAMEAAVDGLTAGSIRFDLDEQRLEIDDLAPFKNLPDGFRQRFSRAVSSLAEAIAVTRKKALWVDQMIGRVRGFFGRDDVKEEVRKGAKRLGEDWEKGR